MNELIRTNDVVLIPFIEALLRDAGINFLVADENMSIMEGSIGVLPRRVMIALEDMNEAQKLLEDAGIQQN